MATKTVKEPPLTLSRRLRLAREEAGLEQGQIARLLEDEGITVSRVTISLWENGGGMRDPIAVMEAWSKVTHVPYEWLAEGARVSNKVRSEQRFRSSGCTSGSADQDPRNHGACSWEDAA